MMSGCEHVPMLVVSRCGEKENACMDRGDVVNVHPNYS